MKNQVDEKKCHKINGLFPGSYLIEQYGSDPFGNLPLGTIQPSL